MRSPILTSRPFFLLALVLACGAAPSPAPIQSPQTPQTAQPAQTAQTAAPTGTVDVTVHVTNEIADSTHPTEFQARRQVGHYSTPNGKVGFILDLTSQPARMRLDGSPYVLELTSQRTSRGWIDYVAGGVWMRVNEETGRVISFRGPSMTEAGAVVRDADARPLPPLGQN